MAFQGLLQGLRARLLLLALITVIPAFALVIYSAIEQRGHAIKDGESSAISLIRLATHQERQLVDDTRQLLEDIAQLPVVTQRDRPGACNRTLAKLRKPYSFYVNIGVAAPDGDVYCSAVALPGAVNISDRRYFRYALEYGRFSIGDYQVGRVTRQSSINFGYPVLTQASQVQAVVYAALSLRWFEQLMREAKLPPDSIGIVTDSAGTLLARYPGPEDGIGNIWPDATLIQAFLDNEREGTVESKGADGVTRFYTFAPLYQKTDGNIYIGIGIPAQVVFAGVREIFLRNLIFLLLASVAVLIAAWFGSEVFILRRINVLTAAAQRFAKGDLSVRTGLPPSNEEIGQLAGTLDGMAAALQHTNRALETLSAGNRALVRATDEQRLLEDMCRLVIEVGRYRFAWIGYAERDPQQMIRPMAQYGFDGGLEALSKILAGATWADTERGRGAVATAIRTASPVLVQNIQAHPGFAPWWDEAKRRGYASTVAFPLYHKGLAVGAVSIFSEDVNAFDTKEIELLTEFAEDLAFGIGILRGRAETQQAQATIRRLAYQDGLTGLPNHAHFLERLQKTLSLASVEDQHLALVVIDLNGLRDINSAFGFYQGDLIIKETSVRLRDTAPDDSLVARLRGDEFAVLAPINIREDAASIARELLDALRAPFMVNDLAIEVSATAGVSLFPKDGTEPVQLLRHADVALQQANPSVREYVFYDAGYDERGTQRLEMAGELRHAIEAGELVLHYQPKVTMRDRQVCGAEALVRWLHPKRGMIPPDQFIPLAERTGLIKPLTDWVLHAALAQSAIWHRRKLSIPVAVNLSTRNLQDSELADRLAQLLQTLNVPAHCLELEITEGAVMDNPVASLAVLTRLSDMGFALFIDDFGTGYSSLSYLKKLPVDAMKIDKSFVLDMLASRDSAAIVRSTVGLAHELDLKVVAEGIENQAVWDHLVALGCDVAQGYYLSKPVPAEQFESWLGSWDAQARKDRA